MKIIHCSKQKRSLNIVAEYMALSEATKEEIFLRRFTDELGFGRIFKGTIYCDNQGAKLLSESPVFHSRLKHIDIRHHFVRDAVREGKVNIIHCAALLLYLWTKCHFDR